MAFWCCLKRRWLDLHAIPMLWAASSGYALEVPPARSQWALRYCSILLYAITAHISSCLIWFIPCEWSSTHEKSGFQCASFPAPTSLSAPALPGWSPETSFLPPVLFTGTSKTEQPFRETLSSRNGSIRGHFTFQLSLLDTLGNCPHCTMSAVIMTIVTGPCNSSLVAVTRKPSASCKIACATLI